MRIRAIGLLAGAWLAVAPARSDFISGSDESDGALNITANTVIDLGLAATASWNTPSPVAGQGVYDSLQWAVVFKYSTIDIAPGVTVTFINHPNNPPVVWLATGDVNIGGVINLSGASGAGPNTMPTVFSIPGPGGFGGGQNGLINVPGVSLGFGPGGSPAQNSCGSTYSTGGCGAPYGNTSVFPLIGGSGGAGDQGAWGGGAGGGAILIATSTRISLPTGGGIVANGGGGNFVHGTGGAIRLIANESIIGSGLLSAVEPGGQDPGRIRLEAFEINFSQGNSNPDYYPSFQWGPVFADAAEVPTLRATLVDNLPVPADPQAGIRTIEVVIDTDTDSTILIEATNIPAGTTVRVRAVPERGAVVNTTYVESTPLADPEGDGVLTATATLRLPPGITEIQLRANW